MGAGDGAFVVVVHGFGRDVDKPASVVDLCNAAADWP